MLIMTVLFPEIELEPAAEIIIKGTVHVCSSTYIRVCVCKHDSSKSCYVILPNFTGWFVSCRNWDNKNDPGYGLIVSLPWYRYAVYTQCPSSCLCALVKMQMYFNVQLRLSLEWGPLFPTYRQVSPKWKLVLANWKLTADTVMKPVSSQKWKKKSNFSQSHTSSSIQHTSTVVRRLNVYELC